MIAKIVPIGNSRGIRIPKQVLQQFNITNQIELVVDEKKHEIILKPVKKTRDGWDESFREMHDNRDDQLIIDDGIDFNDWEW